VTSMLTIGAAWLLGLAASGHCVLMCGGISTALGMATSRNIDGKLRMSLLIAYQAGRTASYCIIGVLLGGALGGVVSLLNVNGVRLALRTLSAAALFLAAFAVLRRQPPPGVGVGARLWIRLAPLGRKLLPVRTLPRALAFGMIWGWMPCGAVYMVLALATLQSDALRAAATMAAFGVGTAPAMLVMTAGGQRFLSLAGGAAGRRLVGGLICVCGALTLIGPWLIAQSTWVHRWLPLGCLAK
jgi:sulfite exporter TauE/SafE